MRDPGTAKTSTIAKHWDVCLATARRIIAEAELPVADENPNKYRWMDIWLLEGDAYVPPDLWRDFKAPLLKVSDLSNQYPKEDDRSEIPSARTFRRRVEQGRLPSIKLTEDTSRVRACVFDKLKYSL